MEHSLSRTGTIRDRCSTNYNGCMQNTPRPEDYLMMHTLLRSSHCLSNSVYIVVDNPLVHHVSHNLWFRHITQCAHQADLRDRA